MDNKPNRDKKIEDVFFAPKKKAVSLREKVWRIELRSRDIKQFLKDNRSRFILVLVVFIFIVSFLGYLLVTKAEVVNFYPTSCLGGWQNPQNAQNRPELGKNALPEEFNETNSAVLENVISQIFCGDFQGEMPENSQPKKVVVKFSWLVKLGTGDKQQAPSDEQEATSTLIEIIFPEATSTEEETPIIVPEETTSTPAIQEETAPPEEATSSPPTSFWQKIINFAFAEETPTQENPIVQEASTSSLPEPLLPIPSEQSSDTESSILDLSAPSDDGGQIGTELSPEPEVSTSTPEEAPAVTSTEQELATTTPEISEPEPFLEILYTLDGANWQSLGKVNYDNWQNLELEIPNFNWEDISKLQISIQSLSPVDFVPTVYLDGLWLEVEYENLSSASISGSSEEEPAGPEQNPETVGAVDSEIVLVLKIFDEKAKHKCVIEPFSQQIIKGTSVNYDISLMPSGASRPYEIILGDLPSGVEANFNQSLLTLTAGINAQNGSFNIAVIYRETQEDGEILSNFCQLNLIIK